VSRSNIEHRISRSTHRSCAGGTISSRGRGVRPAPSTAPVPWHGRVWKPVRPAAELSRDSALFAEFE
jgi:hypothetical protein